MVDKVTVKRLDDLHSLEGEEIPADRRYTFVFDNTPYQLDLSLANAEEFERVFKVYLEAATPVKADTAATKPKKAGGVKRSAANAEGSAAGSSERKITKATARAIREFAADHGIMLKQRGPLPVELKEKYAAHLGITVEELR